MENIGAHGLRYVAGDHVGVYASNPKEVVEAMMTRLDGQHGIVVHNIQQLCCSAI